MACLILSGRLQVPIAGGHEQRAVAQERQARSDVAVRGAPVVGDEDVADVLQRIAVESSASERDRRAIRARFRIGEIEQVVFRELRMKRNVEQALLAARMYARCAGDRLPLQNAMMNKAQSPSRSVTSVSPSGRNARLQGCDSPVTTVNTRMT